MPYIPGIQQPIRSSTTFKSVHTSASSPTTSPLQAKIDNSFHQVSQQKRVMALQGALQRRTLPSQPIQIGIQGISREAIQRKVFKQGSTNATAIPAGAKKVANWVMKKTSVQPGGKNFVADVHGRGFAGFKIGKSEYVGGRAFNNNAQPDNNKLPYVAGQTYQEWDINPSVAGVGRGVERIVTSSSGKAYYTNDHYANFTEFIP